jgi:hypothetical protein
MQIKIYKLIKTKIKIKIKIKIKMNQIKIEKLIKKQKPQNNPKKKLVKCPSMNFSVFQ